VRVVLRECLRRIAASGKGNSEAVYPMTWYFLIVVDCDVKHRVSAVFPDSHVSNLRNVCKTGF